MFGLLNTAAPSSLRRIATTAIAAIVTASVGLGSPVANAQQRVRFPSPSYNNLYGTPQGNNWSPNTTLAQAPQAGRASSPWVPVNPRAGGVPSAPGAVLGNIQPFDPYASPNPSSGAPLGTVGPQAGPQLAPNLPAGRNATPWVPVNPGSPGAAPTIPGPNIQPPALPSTITGPIAPQFPAAPNAPNYQLPNQPTPFGQPPAPLNGSIGPRPIQTAPIQTAPLFPNGMTWGGEPLRLRRFIQDTGALYTYQFGGDGARDLEMNELELFTSAVFENFAHTSNSFRVTPGIGFHFLEGPRSVGGVNMIDMPAQLYSPYIDTLWQPQLTPQFGADVNLRVGYYSDFDNGNSDAVRFTGRGLGVLQLTPTTAFKLGVEYLDRLDVKLLPAGGILWTPNPQTYFDIYFPRPKLSQYWTTVGNTEIWWHVGGEYGGGSWAIRDRGAGVLPPTAPDDEQQVDINDIRVFLGIDWSRLNRIDGVAEIGYVFDREIVARHGPTRKFDLDDTFMIRAGLKY